MSTVKNSKQTVHTDAHTETGVIKENKTVDPNKPITHVVPANRQIPLNNITMVPLKKLTVIRTLIPSEIVIKKEMNPQQRNEVVLKEEIDPLQHSELVLKREIEPPQPLTIIDVKSEVYQQRKRQLPEYKELFAALMKLSDHEMRTKLFSVINNHSIEQRSVETQTDAVEFKETNHSKGKNQIPFKDNIHLNKTTNPSGSENFTQKSHNDTTITGEVAKKRKRKRKISIPQVNKESRAKHLAKMNKPKTSITNGCNSVAMPDVPGPYSLNANKRQRIESICLSECSLDVVNTFEDTQTNHTKEIEQSDNKLENGLLPIQDAVVRNQINKLNLHILIWQNRGVDLNDILTDEDEDLLQLAVLNTCDPSIVSLLLEKKLNPNSLDAESNTIIHLAILNDITATSLEHVMNHIDLKLLLTLNDDGYTPLHLAIRQDRYLLAERLITILDKRLVDQTYYKRHYDELETDENVLKKQFKEYYEKVCLQMINDEDSTSCPIDNHDLKQKLLQAGDRRSGNTALYFAIDNKFEHLIYFLLAHLTDPRTENLSGLDCKTYFSEYGKSLNLSLNIDNSMEKVIKLLS